MKRSLARALLQLLAVLTGLLVAAFWREKGNVLLDYPVFSSTKAGLGLGVMGAQSFLRSPVTLAGGALNLGAWHGHQEVALEGTWSPFPAVKLRVRAEGASELAVEYRPEAPASGTTVARFSNRPARPSAWLTADGAGRFTGKARLAYELPAGRWVNLELRPGKEGLEALADGKAVGAPAPLPVGPVRVLLRGDSSAGRLRVADLTVSSGSRRLHESFAGKMPWEVFLAATVLASLLALTLERFAGPAPAAAASGALFLALGAGLALYRGTLANRYPLELDLRGAPSRIEAAPEMLARVRALPKTGKPLLLWLGGSQAWGAGASGEGATAFGRLRAALEAKSNLEWVNAATSSTGVREQLKALAAARERRPVTVAVLTTGVNDAENRRYAEDLSAAMKEIRATGTKLLLVPEPTEPGSAETFAARRAEAADLARRAGVSVADLQPDFDAAVDDGFLWWDFVHLSDAGAALEARALEAVLRGELGIR